MRGAPCWPPARANHRFASFGREILVVYIQYVATFHWPLDNLDMEINLARPCIMWYDCQMSILSRFDGQ